MWLKKYHFRPKFDQICPENDLISVSTKSLEDNLHISTCFFVICVKFLIWCDFWVKWIIIVLCIFLWFFYLRLRVRSYARLFVNNVLCAACKCSTRTCSLSSYFWNNMMCSVRIVELWILIGWQPITNDIYLDAYLCEWS